MTNHLHPLSRLMENGVWNKGDLDLKVDRRCKDRLRYLIAWLGYEDMDEATLWITSKEVGHAP